MKNQTIMNLRDLLIEFEEIFRTYNPRLANMFANGLSENELIQELVPLGVTNPSIYTLFQWHDGIKYLSNQQHTFGEIEIFFGSTMRPLQQMVNKYHEESSIEEGVGDTFFPIFDNGLSGLLVKKNGSDPFVYSTLKYHFDTPVTIFESVENIVKTVIECYKNGVYILEADGSLEVNFDLEWDIAKKLNPDCTYWL